MEPYIDKVLSPNLLLICKVWNMVYAYNVKVVYLLSKIYKKKDTMVEICIQQYFNKKVNKVFKKNTKHGRIYWMMNIKLTMHSRLIHRYTKELTFLIAKTHTNRRGISLFSHLCHIYNLSDEKYLHIIYLLEKQEIVHIYMIYMLNLLSLKI